MNDTRRAEPRAVQDPSNWEALWRPETDDECLWGLCPEADSIRRLSATQATKPLPVLAHTLLRVVSAIPHTTTIEWPDSLSPLSANLGMIVYGKPSAGKADARRGSDVLVHVPGEATGITRVNSVGSGEGISASLVRAPHGNSKIKNIDPLTLVMEGEPFTWRHKSHTLLIQEDEGSKLNSPNYRSTLTELGKAFYAEQLGAPNKHKDTRIMVPEGEYRLAWAIDIQPDEVDFIMESESIGFPIRNLWVQAGAVTRDRSLDLSRFTKVEITPIAYPAQIRCTEAVKEEFRQREDAMILGESNERHLLAVALKWSAALAVFAGSDWIDAQHWRAGLHLVSLSREVYKEVKNDVEDARAVKDVERGESMATQLAARDDELAFRDVLAYSKAKERVRHMFESASHGAPFSRNDVRDKVGPVRDRLKVMNQILNDLEDDGIIIAEQYVNTKGRIVQRYLRGHGTPLNQT